MDQVVVAQAAQEADDLGDEDLAAGGDAAEPGGLDDRRAVEVVVLGGDVAGRQADPNGQRRRDQRLAVHPLDRLLDGHRRRHCVRRPTERGHQAVAETLDHPAAVGFHRLGQQPVVPATELFGLLLPQPGPQFGGTDQVGEQDSGRRPHAVIVRRDPQRGHRVLDRAPAPSLLSEQHFDHPVGI